MPFIAQYRKELCGELLALRYRDEPGTVDEGEATKDIPRGTIRVRCLPAALMCGGLLRMYSASCC